jgi:nucleoside-diphosphate-sugar epimerase
MAFRATDLQADPCTSGIDYKSADITNPSTLTPVMTGITSVIHAAGLAHIFDSAQAEKAFFNAINVTGTVNMINAAVLAGVQHFVLISSVSVYGPFTQGVYDEGVSCNPVGPYALSKHNAERRAQEITKKSGMTLTILRFATLYGEDDPGNVGRLIRSLDQGRFIWIGDGRNRKSLLYKEDAARACLAVMAQPASGINIYNVSAPPHTMQEIVDTIAKGLGKNPLSIRIPGALALNMTNFISKLSNQRFAGLHTMIQKWLAEDVYNTNRFEEAYGFQTKTSLEDGLKREVDWYRQKQQNG